MKKYLIISVVAAGVLAGCGADENPGRSYMPDMTYSRAYETYASTNDLEKEGVFYNRKPVPGTVARGEDMAFTFNLPHDSAGYAQSAQLRNPLDSAGAAKIDMKEAERLYLVNCGICHGAKLDGNGPLFNGGEGPFTAAPKDFMAADMKALPEGTMYYSVTYGKGQMGSYASQLSPKQRWEIIAFIKSKQGVGGAAPAAAADSTAKTAEAGAAADATAKK
ncbi:c-type cytochrome [Niabella beijingensis]|uniref:c-type cytochrome n=1 Tax=Niabella beijingensis TaxID=2872700 RepID=UPI001CBFF15F|nr:cytochrome c [Niabella beijingensis]MBZ4189060.1 cytochrome c [Niabella beijingensis]